MPWQANYCRTNYGIEFGPTESSFVPRLLKAKGVNDVQKTNNCSRESHSSCCGFHQTGQEDEEKIHQEKIGKEGKKLRRKPRKNTHS